MFDDLGETLAFIVVSTMLAYAFMMANGITPWYTQPETQVSHIHVESTPHSYNLYN